MKFDDINRDAISESWSKIKCILDTDVVSAIRKYEELKKIKTILNRMNGIIRSNTGSGS